MTESSAEVSYYSWFNISQIYAFYNSINILFILQENILPEEISKIPFSDLQKLTKECGSKVLSDFVTSKKNSPKKCEFHRENKNR